MKNQIRMLLLGLCLTGIVGCGKKEETTEFDVPENISIESESADSKEPEEASQTSDNTVADMPNSSLLACKYPIYISDSRSYSFHTTPDITYEINKEKGCWELKDSESTLFEMYIYENQQAVNADAVKMTQSILENNDEVGHILYELGVLPTWRFNNVYVKSCIPYYNLYFLSFPENDYGVLLINRDSNTLMSDYALMEKIQFDDESDCIELYSGIRDYVYSAWDKNESTESTDEVEIEEN